MKINLLRNAALMVVAALSCAIAPVRAVAQDAHGAGPNGGVVFDLGSHHAEFTVDHDKQEATVLILDAAGKQPGSIAAEELILITKDAKTADGKDVPSLTVVLVPKDLKNGKSSTFVGSDPGIANVVDFAGAVTGDIDGKPANGEFDEAAGGHAHSSHDGVVAAVKNDAGAAVGFVELKLHDDKGDLEAWLGKDRQIKEPVDLPASSSVTVTFEDRNGKAVLLHVRNNKENEDEDGKANMRGGQTNYFIFPGDSGQDATWLMGKDFQSAVKVSFNLNGKEYSSDEFTLRPHTHADGHGHAH